MIIRNQLKDNIVSINNISCIFVGGLNENRVMAGIANDASVSLAEYTTKEKALKVLDMICNEYQYCEECKYIGVGASQPEFVFQMPQDSEV